MIFSNRKLRMIIVIILLMIFCYFIGIYKPKAEVLGTGIYGLNYNDESVHWQTSCGVLDMTGNTGLGHCVLNNVNLYGNGNGKLYITNGGVLSNKTVSFVVYNGNNNIDLSGIFLEDNSTAYSCEIYSSLYNQNTMTYNVICPNLPTLTGNATNINFMLVNQTPQTFVVNLDIGISAINGWENGTTTINDIKNATTNINNSLNDSNVDDSSTSTSGFSNTTNSALSNSPVSNLIALPITFLTGVNNAISSSCTNVNYIELFNYQLVLPCLNLSERLGNVWVIIDTIVSCMLLFSIGKSLVSTFARLSDMDTNIMYECYANGKDHRGESF